MVVTNDCVVGTEFFAQSLQLMIGDPVTSCQLPVNDLCLVSGQLRNHLICSQKQSISTFLLLANSTNIYNYIHIVQNDTISVIDPQDVTSLQHLAVTTDSYYIRFP